MITRKTGTLTLLSFHTFSKYSGIINYSTTRLGGVSSGHLESLNLGFTVGDDPKNVTHNRELLAEAIGISPGSFIFPKQTSNDNIAVVTESMKPGKIVEINEDLRNTDALVTNVRGLCLNVLTADCVPVIFYDPVKSAIGISHAGWKGTVKQISRKTLLLMVSQFGCNPADIIAGIGPSIGPQSYEVGMDVISEVEKVFQPANRVIIYNSINGKPIFNLWQANIAQLTEAGIRKENIEISSICTFQNSDLFYSARKTGGKCGRFATGVMLL